MSIHNDKRLEARELKRGASLLCNEHGRAEERARVRSGANRPAGVSKARAAAATKEPVGDQCSHRKAVHRALSGFLFHPFDECAYRHTIDVMHDFELRARLLSVLPPPDASDTAVSLTTLTSDASASIESSPCQ